ncbi:hypothetical protein HRR83_000275 [Exophiala dermatitidis]|nr:hypothetical protein HRR73_002811 [Exophiala dermatitidis]KAJ4527523.1 hypothetical protein HRR74_000277 [Exophiala dermatitidis]KAJ4531096.1 hypothetical protein HRR76_008773 [Exophiala dermatitidis]KAJ4558262.1 hypothetical protein HRR77_000276 [Exophiala dermatitidis]KAJ4581700.1 hypothetical protein HRR79_000717 [Exophiala dermatitidis]
MMTTNIKVVVLGAEAVGKTTLIHQFLLQESVDDPKHTTNMDIYRVNVPMHQKVVNVSVIDAGDKIPKDFNDVDAVLMAFSTVSQDSFAKIKLWSSLMHSFREQEKPMALVGTKMDLDPQLVSYEDGFTLSQEVGACYFHLSTSNYGKVRDVFNFLLQRRLLPEMQPPMLAQRQSQGTTQQTSILNIRGWLWPFFPTCGWPRKTESKAWYS